MNDLFVFPQSPSHEEIHRIKEVMLASDGAIDLSDHTFHHFADGVYGRELRIPAGVALVGKMHRYSTLNILAEGELAVTTPDGPKIIKSPSIFVSPPGTEKIGYAITDCVFLNVHASKETDLEKLEKELIVPDELSIGGGSKCLG